MKTGGLLSMIACFFIIRDVVIKFNKGERIRLTHKIVCEVCTLNCLVCLHLFATVIINKCMRQKIMALRYCTADEFGSFLGFVLFTIYEHLDG